VLKLKKIIQAPKVYVNGGGGGENGPPPQTKELKVDNGGFFLKASDIVFQEKNE